MLVYVFLDLAHQVLVVVSEVDDAGSGCADYIKEDFLLDRGFFLFFLELSREGGHTLCDVDIGAREAIRGEEVGVHVDAVLLCVRRVTGQPPAVVSGSPLWERQAPTESSTLLRALSSSSVFSFLRCNSVKVRWAEPPLAARAVVGPDGTVGAWRLFILNGRPIALQERLLFGGQSGFENTVLSERRRWGRGPVN